MICSRKEVLIFNNGHTKMSLGKYARDLNDATSELSILISFVYSRNNIDKEFPGEKVLGLYPPFTSGWQFNVRFPQISFKETRKRMNDHKKRGGVVHYSSHSVSPLDRTLDNIVSIHDIIFTKREFRENDPADKLGVKFLNIFKRFENIITSTEYVKRDLENIGAEGKIMVIPNPVSKNYKYLNNKKEARMKLNLPADKKLILSVSSERKRKNLNVVGEAMERLTDFKLVRLGSPLGSSINFRNLEERKLNLLYNACDLLLFPTLEEGFGYPVIEAFSSGLPVVSSDIPVIREVAGDSAILIDPYNLNDIIKGVKVAYENANSLSQKGMERAKLYSFDLFKERMLGLYKNETGFI